MNKINKIFQCLIKYVVLPGFGIFEETRVIWSVMWGKGKAVAELKIGSSADKRSRDGADLYWQRYVNRSYELRNYTSDIWVARRRMRGRNVIVGCAAGNDTIQMAIAFTVIWWLQIACTFLRLMVHRPGQALQCCAMHHALEKLDQYIRSLARTDIKSISAMLRSSRLSLARLNDAHVYQPTLPSHPHSRSSITLFATSTYILPAIEKVTAKYSYILYYWT